MEASKNKQLQQEASYAVAVVDEDATTNNNKTMKHLDSDAGEPEENYRGWKAMPYVIGNETCEKLGTIGTTANLLVYLTTVYRMKSASATTLLSLWGGTVNMAPVLGAFLSDSYLGRYTTIALASMASFAGMIVLTLTAAVPSLHPRGGAAGPSATHMAVLLLSFGLLAVGAGGIRPCNLAFGADQFDPRTPSGRKGINSFFNWYYFTFTIAMMVSATVIIYLQSSVNWALGLAVPATLMGLSCALFFMGTRLYVRVRPEGSPLTSLAQVVVAAYRKRHVPGSQEQLLLLDPPHRSSLITKIAYTDQFVCLDKAAVVVSPSDEVTDDGSTPPRPLAAVHGAAGGGGEVPGPPPPRVVVGHRLLHRAHQPGQLQRAAGHADRPPHRLVPDPRGLLRGLQHAGPHRLDPRVRPAGGAGAAAGDQARGRHLAAAAHRRRHRALHRHHAAGGGGGAPPPHGRRRHLLLRAGAAADAGRPVGGLRRDRPGGLLLQAVPREHAQRRRRAALPGLRRRQLRQRPHGHRRAPHHRRPRRPARLAHGGPQQGTPRPLLPAHRRHGRRQPRLLRRLRALVQVQTLGRLSRPRRAGGERRPQAGCCSSSVNNHAARGSRLSTQSVHASSIGPRKS